MPHANFPMENEPSELGEEVDIERDNVAAVAGSSYGDSVLILSRPPLAATSAGRSVGDEQAPGSPRNICFPALSGQIAMPLRRAQTTSPQHLDRRRGGRFNCGVMPP